MTAKLPEGGPERCNSCNWPLAARMEDGCIPGNCSYRPSDAPATSRDRNERTIMAFPRTDTEELLDEVERLRAENADLRREMNLAAIRLETAEYQYRGTRIAEQLDALAKSLRFSAPVREVDRDHTLESWDQMRTELSRLRAERDRIETIARAALNDLMALISPIFGGSHNDAEVQRARPDGQLGLYRRALERIEATRDALAAKPPVSEELHVVGDMTPEAQEAAKRVLRAAYAPIRDADGLRAENAALRAERDRYRAALERISDDCELSLARFDDCGAVARIVHDRVCRALAAGETDNG